MIFYLFNLLFMVLSPRTGGEGGWGETSLASLRSNLNKNHLMFLSQNTS